MTDQARDERALWMACSGTEAAATVALSSLLSSFEPALSACYESGVLAPTLPALRHNQSDVSVAALFLKRALTDLRSVWLLVAAGYTCSAASVGAAAIENALAVSAIAGNPDRASELLASEEGDVPWSPQKLAQFRAERWKADGTVSSQADFEMAWREVYSAYKWLCKIKHPTLRSATHEAASTALVSSEYVVMAAPDIRDEDRPVKAIILTTVTNHVKAAVIHFAGALSCLEPSPAYARFKERIESVDEMLKTAYDPAMTHELPFTIRTDKVAREWHQLKVASQPSKGASPNDR